MTNVGAQNITPGTAAQTITQGYHDGSGTVEGDTDLAAGNIASGVQIFGVTGTAVVATGDASAVDVLTGKTFSNAGGSGIAGTMPKVGQQNITPGTTNQTITQGYHDGTGYAEGDADLTAENIKCGVEIFGVTGIIPQYVAKTGQTTCYDGGGTEIGCDNTGQDAEYRNGGLPVLAPSSGGDFGGYNRTSFTCSAGFTDNEDGTVTDNLTGLVWARNANPCGVKNWADALIYCNDLDLGGHNDWRLPNINELRSLFDPSLSSPYLPAGHPFTNVQSLYYWSSTTYESDPFYAWFVGMFNGTVYLGSKDYEHYVWPVRSGN
jgi:hypothetical protein